MSLLFQDNERVLCFHGPLVYEAKVLKAELWEGKENPDENGPHYFVHYKGWKSSWDEWVPESRVLKWNEENLQKQKDLRESNTIKKSKPREKSTTFTGTDRGRKRARESTEKEEAFLKRPEIKITIPDTLKVQLVNDWEFITKNQKLVSLPRQPTVSKILEDFKKSLSKKTPTGASNEMIDEVIEGIQLYFDKALGNCLLYRFERNQYVEIKKSNPDTDLSDLYGGEHLLRLFVLMPQFISHTNMDQDTVNILRDYFAELLQYMQTHADNVFLKEYDNANPQYLNELDNPRDAIDPILSRLKNTHAVSLELANILRERAVIEERYSSDLAKLSQKASTLEFGKLSNSWGCLLSLNEKLSRIHGIFGQNIKNLEANIRARSEDNEWKLFKQMEMELVRLSREAGEKDPTANTRKKG
ncbi:Esa1p-associated factor, partial [Nowakowskiella sp. JEL0407]